MICDQSILELPSRPRGFHLITDEIIRELSRLPSVSAGMLNLFLQHTSASLTINENASPDVWRDLEMGFSRIAPEDWPYHHTEEGPDDMPAHVKAAILGNSLDIPVRDGRLALGTWQGIFLCEHRNAARRRQIVLTLIGKTSDRDW